MNRAEREITAPIKIDELQQLLNTMTPEQEQMITTKTRISDVQAAAGSGPTAAPPPPPPPKAAEAPIEPEIPRLFTGVDWDKFLNETVSKMVTPRKPRPLPPPIPRSLDDSERPKRKYGRPFSQVAALLPGCEPALAPRGARPAPWARPKTQTSLAVVEQKAPRTVAELRARLESGETPALWAASSALSPQVLAHLTAEEIAMLPAEIRGAIPEPVADNPCCIEIAAAPCASVVDVPSARLPARLPEVNTLPQRSAAIIASIASMILVAACAVYFMS